MSIENAGTQACQPGLCSRRTLGGSTSRSTVKLPTPFRVARRLTSWSAVRARGAGESSQPCGPAGGPSSTSAVGWVPSAMALNVRVESALARPGLGVVGEGLVPSRGRIDGCEREATRASPTRSPSNNCRAGSPKDCPPPLRRVPSKPETAGNSPKGACQPYNYVAPLR
jgi:hypothetical protein